jgi:hypothetical protein
VRAQLIRIALQPDAQAWSARVTARKQSTGTRLSAQRILKLRDADRR